MGSEGITPLLDNPLLQSSFLLNHLLLPTLYSALTPESFKNRTGNQRFQYYMSKNQEVINAINQNLTAIIKRNSLRDGKTYVENSREKCRRKRNLAYSLSSVQGTLLDLQDTVAKSFFKRHLGNEVTDLVNSMVSHINTQKERLDKMKDLQAKFDEDEARFRRTTTKCKEPFFAVGWECFYVSHKEKLGWHEAKAACHKLQAYLAEPERPRALAKVLKKIDGHFNRCWIGGSDEEQEGDWKWLSGGTLNGSHEWRPGQPSNYSLRGDVQDCLVLLRNRGGAGPTLDDFSCWANRAFICETDPEC